MSNSTDAKPPTLPCPLARDRDGNPIDLPEGAVAWRVRRHTGGRPRILLGADKQPMQLPLGYTLADVEDILSPGAYRLDIVDQRGEPLSVTVPLAVTPPRNADGSIEVTDDEAEEVPVTVLPAVGSETRLVLEANVRATQLAFQHNQRTLELGLKMAETLRDGVNVLASAQADWIKAISSSRGFFRNAPPLPLPPAPPPANDDDDDDEQEAQPPPRQPDWLEKVTPFVTLVTQQIVNAFAARQAAPPKAGAAKPSLLRNAFNWGRAAEEAKAARAEPEPEPKTEDEALPPLDPASMHHFLKIQAALQPAEAELAKAVAAELTPREMRIWFEELRKLSVPDAVAKIRSLIAAKPAA